MSDRYEDEENKEDTSWRDEPSVAPDAVEQYKKDSAAEPGEEPKDADWSVNTEGMNDPRNTAMNGEETRDFVSETFPHEHTDGMTFDYDGRYVETENGHKAAESQYDPFQGADHVNVHAQNPDGTATDTESMSDSIKHEVGHNVYDNCLSQEEQAEWNDTAAIKHTADSSANQEALETIVEHDGDIEAACNDRKDLDTEIKETWDTLQEDFANAYRDYINGDLDEDSQEYAFMREHVFR